MELIDNLKKKLKQLNRWSLIIIFLFLLLFSLFLFVILRNTPDENKSYYSNVNGETSKLIKTGDETLYCQNNYYVSINYSSKAYISQTYSIALLVEVLENELNYSLYLSQISIRLLFLDSSTSSIQQIYSILPEKYLSLEPIFSQEVSFSFPDINTGNWALYVFFNFPESNPDIDEHVTVQFPIKVYNFSTFDKVMAINPIMMVLPLITLFALLRRKKNASKL
ncbi:MAG: hypothetical protein ACTSYA_03040 [Candidatus Kariarchaeaceae archaeon]